MSQQQVQTTAQPSRAPAKVNVVQQVSDLFEKNRKAIEDALPKHLTTERMMRIALTELRKVPRLQQCDPFSFLGAIVQAAQLGLEPGGALGHCYLIPYGREVQLQIGYRGMVDLARRSGNIVSISARIVYQGDIFGIEYGTEEAIQHIPKFESNVITHVYAIAKLRDGGTQFEIMPLVEIEEIRDNHSAGYQRDPKGSPWAKHFGEMAKKTLVRRLFKMLPTSVEIRDAIRVDEEEDQQNHRIIDARHEVLSPLPDPGRFAEASGGEDAPMSTADVKAAIDADRRVALAELDRVAKLVIAAKINPADVLGTSLDAVRQDTVERITVATDVLAAALERA